MRAAETIYEIAQTRPTATALVYNLQPLSYSDFHRMITAARRRVRAWGLPDGGVVVLWIDNIQAGWVIALALRTAGHTTAMIRSAGELEQFTGVTVAALVTLAGEWFSTQAAGAGPPHFVVRPQDWAFDPDAALEPPPQAASGGHILLTSGTTGSYKMVLIDDRFEAMQLSDAADLVQRHGESIGASDPQSRWVHYLSFGLWTAAGYTAPILRWTYGGCAVIQQGGDLIASYLLPGVSVAILIPIAASAVLDAAAGRLASRRDCSVIVAGGALSSALAARIKAEWTTNLFTVLGSTEGGIWALTPIEDEDDLRWHRISPEREVQIVDEDDRPLPAGQLGQVRVRLTNGLSGYLNAPEATAEAFRDGFFYPGDLGVLDAGGRLALHGRVTDVINIQGEKQAAGPYEAALQKALGVEGVCLFSHQGEGAAEELHVVLERSRPVTLDALTAAARACLHGFPDVRFHAVDALPRNHMGKVERFKLRQSLFGAPEPPSPRADAVVDPHQSATSASRP